MTLGIVAVTIAGCAPALTPSASPSATGTVSGPTAGSATTPAAETPARETSPPGTSAAGASPTAASAPETAPPEPSPPETPAPHTPVSTGGGPPERVLEAGYSEPSLVVDAAGHAHIAAVRVGGVYHLTSTSGTWTSAQLSTPNDGDEDEIDRQPSLAIDGDGSLALAFSRWGPEDTFGRLPRGIHFAAADAGAWSEAAALIDDPNGGHSPSLVVRDGSLHLAYVLGIGVDVITEEQSFPVRLYSDGEGAPRDAEVSPNGTAPVLALGPDGAAHVVFGDEYGLLGGDALRHAAAEPGREFGVEMVPGTTRYAAPYDLAVDPSGTAHLAWTRPGFTTAEDRYAAYYQTRGDAWGEPQLVALDATVSAVAADAHGHVHLVGSDLDGAWYATNRDGSFVLTRLANEPEVGADVFIDAFARAHVVFAIGEAEEAQLWYAVRPGP